MQQQRHVLPTVDNVPTRGMPNPLLLRRNSTEEPVEVAVACDEGRRSESAGQAPQDAGNQSAEGVKERAVQ
jgi:hypothetical protein